MRSLLFLAAVACGSSPPTPWVDATSTDEVLDAHFRAAIGAPSPGAGVFTSAFASGDDAAHAILSETQGAKEPILVVRLAGRSATGWNTLELDVASSAWRAGEIAMDGTEAIGRLERADGTVRLVTGTLVVEEAGLQEGDVVSGSLTEAVLSMPGGEG